MAVTMTVEQDERISTRQKSEVRESFERWARWRSGAKYYGGGGSGGAAGGLLGALRNGRGSSVCPTCKGGRRLPGHLVGSSQEFINVPCPGCDGEGTVQGDLAATKRTREIACVYCRDPVTGTSRGEVDGRTCHKCQGGKRLLVELKVHPATIKGTRYMGPDGEPDPIAALVDRTVMGWAERNHTYWLARVVTQEYCSNGTQEMKYRKLGVSKVWYIKNLMDAHRCMAGILRNNGH
jgi:hypothetical protein